ncbi:MAG: hypothetical protein WED00_06440 [Aquisalimonadaceae bacterium]
MKVHVSFQRISRSLKPHLEKRFAELAERKLARYLKHYEPDLVHLEGRIEQSPNHKLHRTRLRLKLPSDILAVTEEGHEPVEQVLRESFEELTVRLRKHLDRLRNASEWERSYRRQRLRKWIKEAPDVREEERRLLYFDLISSHLDTLYNFVQREIAYLESSGDLERETVSPEEVVDETILRGYEEFEKRPARLPVDHWLLSLAVMVTASITTNLRLLAPLEFIPTGGYPPPPLRAWVPWTPPDIAVVEGYPTPTLDDIWRGEEDRQEYWTPEGRLRLEDLVANVLDTDTPEEEAERREVQRLIQQNIARLPRSWRQAVVLTTMEELTEEEAAEVLGEKVETVREMLANAHAFLRTRLMETGYAEEKAADWPAAEIRTTVPTPMPDAQRRELQRLLASDHPA